MHIEGKVVWNRREIARGELGNKTAGMGILFQKIKKDDLDVIKELLDPTRVGGWFL